MFKYYQLWKKINDMHCWPSTCTFPRTVDGPDITFDMEPKLPRLQNLAGHAADRKGKRDENIQDRLTSEEKFNVKRSAEIMEAFLKEGELNPEVIATYSGLLCIFAAWIVDKSLLWMTGEAPTLQMLFKYLKITYQLPSDTTVCNQLAHIFEELHGKVVCKFSASVVRDLCKIILMRNVGRQVQDCIQYRHMDNTSNGIHIRWHHWNLHQWRLVLSCDATWKDNRRNLLGVEIQTRRI